MATQTVTATAVEHVNVHKKKLYYIMLEDVNGNTYAINVGQKTFDICHEMQNVPKQPKESQKKGS